MRAARFSAALDAVKKVNPRHTAPAHSQPFSDIFVGGMKIGIFKDGNWRWSYGRDVHAWPLEMSFLRLVAVR